MYGAVGETEAGKLPLLCLHGGPGAPHDYLTPLQGIAATGRRVFSSLAALIRIR